MPRGPLPSGEAARRNAPTIPTTKLPAGGREGPAPSWPIELGEAGRAWWMWAWSTPQAAGWSDGDLYFVAHRAELEDAARALDGEEFDVAGLFTMADGEYVRRINDMLRRMRSLAAGKVQLTRAMTDMDDRLGLTPKGMAALRWKILEGETTPAARSASKRRSLKAV